MTKGNFLWVSALAVILNFSLSIRNSQALDNAEHSTEKMTPYMVTEETALYEKYPETSPDQLNLSIGTTAICLSRFEGGKGKLYCRKTKSQDRMYYQVDPKFYGCKVDEKEKLFCWSEDDIKILRHGRDLYGDDQIEYLKYGEKPPRFFSPNDSLFAGSWAGDNPNSIKSGLNFFQAVSADEVAISEAIRSKLGEDFSYRQVFFRRKEGEIMGSFMISVCGARCVANGYLFDGIVYINRSSKSYSHAYFSYLDENKSEWHCKINNLKISCNSTIPEEDKIGNWNQYTLTSGFQFTRYKIYTISEISNDDRRKSIEKSIESTRRLIELMNAPDPCKKPNHDGTRYAC